MITDEHQQQEKLAGSLQAEKSIKQTVADSRWVRFGRKNEKQRRAGGDDASDAAIIRVSADGDYAGDHFMLLPVQSFPFSGSQHVKSKEECLWVSERKGSEPNHVWLCPSATLLTFVFAISLLKLVSLSALFRLTSHQSDVQAGPWMTDIRTCNHSLQ